MSEGMNSAVNLSAHVLTAAPQFQAQVQRQLAAHSTPLPAIASHCDAAMRGINAIFNDDPQLPLFGWLSTTAARRPIFTLSNYLLARAFSSNLQCERELGSMLYNSTMDGFIPLSHASRNSGSISSVFDFRTAYGSHRSNPGPFLAAISSSWHNSSLAAAVAVMLFTPKATPPLPPPPAALQKQVPYALKVITYCEITLTILVASAFMAMSLVALKRMRHEEDESGIAVDLGYAEYSALSAERLGAFDAAHGRLGAFGTIDISNCEHRADAIDQSYASPDSGYTQSSARGDSGGLGASLLYDRQSNRSFRSTSNLSDLSDISDWGGTEPNTPHGGRGARLKAGSRQDSSFFSWLFGDW